MLSRTAANLFWMGRHLERAETAARLLDVGARITLLPNTAEGYRNEWESLLRASGAQAAFAERYGDEITQENIESWLFFDHANPSSVASCIERAREGGRIVRTALTSQVWDALNMAYQELRALERQPRARLDTAMLTDFTTRHGSTVRGAINATQLRNDGWHFVNLGYSLERADATARLLDVKYFVLLPRVEFVGSGLDNYQWQVILRALSAHRAFHWAYGGEVTAGKVADFLILNGESPRSLLTSLYEAVWHLDGLVRRYGAEVPASASGRAHETLEQLMARDIEAIFDEGLHEFLSWFINELASISNAVHDDYLSGRM
ncbi:MULTISPECIES: alpha-E domain-containing protein [Paracoccus]|uniref:Putative alpha-E superfamily protein n=1 Tax=Paracoccus versutus TaxID=34007 RepID=A0A369TZI1_PARVE|nr:MULTISPECIES: alpha-E domain-containing protein [Paracoccus]WGR62827.1 alpha-E domain-containing protein [Paracoccus ferrooxidans]MBT0781206.1 alpha-E domain-containing protein [Paracoccus sp. pheM1]RDD70583.1 alpha-E domain-containing protein [Paracoccus versutus]REF73003.1 putative alpha-E superfamily protein [Paracoccus versutus]WGR55078.1 alpha-E domain-containing protein [Paracoccus versutus]